MGQFLEIRNNIYHDLTFEFLNILYVEATSGPRYREGYIFFYLNKEFYKLNLTAFNSMFGFLSSMNLPYRHVPKDFNSNAFSNEIS